MPEVTLTTIASPLARSAGRAARVSRMGATRSTSTKASIARSKVVARPSGVATLAATPLTTASPVWSLAAAAERTSGRRPVITTFAPLAMRASAMARPMPLDPPGTRTRLPAMFMGSPSSRGRRIVGREQRAPALFVTGGLELVVLADGTGAGDRGAGVDRLEQPLQVRKGGQRVCLVLQHARSPVQPAPGRDVGDCVAVADDVVAAGEMIVQNLVVAFGLAPVAVHGVGEAVGCYELEMHGLAGERADAGRDEQEPGQELRPVFRRTEELAGLVREIEQDGRGIEDPRLLAAWAFDIDDRRHLAVRVDGAEGRRVLLALAGVDRDRLVGQARLFEEERDLGRVRGRVEIEADHRRLLQDSGMGESRRAGAGAAASSTPITMIAVAMLSIGVGASPSTGIARIDATAGISAMMAVAAAAPSSETARLKATIATPLISTP